MKDRQIKAITAAFQRIWNDHVLDTGAYPDSFLIYRGTLTANFDNSCFGERLAQAAIAASDAKIIPELVEALKFYADTRANTLYGHYVYDTENEVDVHDNGSRAQKALESLPEEYR